MALSKAEIRSIKRKHKEVFAHGTADLGYTDCGIWKFLPYVYTKDEHATPPVRSFLNHGDIYVIILILYMLACDSLLVPKSRQMRVSWILCAFNVWYAMSRKYCRIGFQTKKEDDAAEMVSMGSGEPTGGRMDFIIQHLPGWLRDDNILSGGGNKVGKLTFNTNPYDANGIDIPWQGSKIHGIPQGGDQARSYTWSLFNSDESAFQDEYRKAMVGVSAAAVGGGKVISVSSVDSGSDFNAAVLNIDGEPAHRAVHPVVQKALDIWGIEWPDGLRSWQTKSGSWVIEVKYTVDPAKDPARDGADWYADAVLREGYEGDYNSVGWQTEMEINYGAGGGDPVFPFVQVGSPIFVDGFRPGDIMHKMRFFAGYDYGSQNPSAFEVWGVDEKGEPYSVWELYEPCTNIAKHVEKIKRCPYWNRIEKIVCDPSIMSKTQQGASDIKTLSELFEEHGLYLSRGRRAQDVSVAQMFKADYWFDPENPRAFLTKATPNLNKEIMDLRWEKHTSSAVERRRNNPEKIRQKNNHAWDATAVLFDDGIMPLVSVNKRPMAGTFAQAVKDIQARSTHEQRIGRGIHVV